MVERGGLPGRMVLKEVLWFVECRAGFNGDVG